MKKLLSIIAIVLVLVLGYAFITFGATLPIAGATYTLAGSGISSSATSITLQSFTIPQTGQKILDSDLSTTFYATIEPGNRAKQEIVACTTVTQNTGGTATLSGCSRGMSPITPYTASSTLRFVHAGGSQIIFSDAPQLFNQYVAKDNDEIITGGYTFAATGTFATTTVASSTVNNLYSILTRILSVLNIPDFTEGLTVGSDKSISWPANNGIVSGLATPDSSQTTRAANVLYVNNIARQGAATATNATAGITKLSVAAVDVNNPIAVGDNDDRLLGKTTDSFLDLTNIWMRGTTIYFDSQNSLLLGVATDMATTSIHGPQYLFASAFITGASGSIGLLRYSLDYLSGKYSWDNAIETMPPPYQGAYHKSPVIVGNYVYQFNVGATVLDNMNVVRTDIGLTGTTSMTGFNPATSTYNSQQENFFSDGNKIFEMVASSSPFTRYTHIREWSIAGTVLTNTATITLSTSSPIFDATSPTANQYRSFGYKNSSGNFIFVAPRCFAVPPTNTSISQFNLDRYSACSRTYGPTGTLLSTSSLPIFSTNLTLDAQGSTGLVLFRNKIATVGITKTTGEYKYRISVAPLPR